MRTSVPVTPRFRPVALLMKRVSDCSRGATQCFHWAEPAVLLAILAVLIFVMHRENIARLLAGTEPRIGAKTP